MNTYKVKVMLSGIARVDVEADSPEEAGRLAEEFTDIGECNQWSAEVLEIEPGV